MEQQTPPPATEFSSTDIRDYLTPIDDFYLKSEYRQRESDVVIQAAESAGLKVKLSKTDDDGISVPEMDDATRNKYNFVTQLASQGYAANPKRMDYRNIGVAQGQYVNFVETLSIRSRTNANQYFSALKIPTTEQTFTSDNKIVQLKNGDMITAYEAFERLNKQVLSEYVKNDIAGRRFIKEKFGALKKTDPTQSSFYHFFKILNSVINKNVKYKSL